MKTQCRLSNSMHWHSEFLATTQLRERRSHHPVVHHKLHACAKQTGKTHRPEASAWRSVAPKLCSPPDKHERCQGHTPKRSHSKQLAPLFAKGLAQTGNLAVYVDVVSFATAFGRRILVRVPGRFTLLTLTAAFALALALIVVAAALRKRMAPAATLLLGLVLGLSARTLPDKRTPNSKTRSKRTQRQSRTTSVVLLRSTLLFVATAPSLSCTWQEGHMQYDRGGKLATRAILIAPCLPLLALSVGP